jgi:streptogramin lyase
MKNFLIICAIVVFAIISETFSQTGWTYYKYKDLPVHGLSFCIKSDFSNGIFLGLSGGLSKFNGEDWVKIYYNELDPMNGDNKFNIRIINISMGEVWAATNEGLIKFNGYERKHYNLLNFPKMIDDKIRGITGDKYGNIWFVNHALGIFKIDNSADTVVHYSIPQTTPLPFSENIPMFCDANDNLWYACAGKFVKFSNGIIKVIDSTDIPDLKTDKISSIQILSNSSVAVLMKHSIGIYNDYNGTISYNKIDVPTNLLESNEIFNTVKVDLDGNIWVLSNLTDGMGIGSRHFYKYNKNKEWTKYEFPQFEGTTTNIYSLSDFTIDASGKVWFSDPYYGVFVFDSKVTSVENKENNNTLCIFPNPVTDYLILSSKQQLHRIEIYSLLGLKVLETEYKEKIDVSLLIPDIYFLKVGSNVYKFCKINN